MRKTIMFIGVCAILLFTSGCSNEKLIMSFDTNGGSTIEPIDLTVKSVSFLPSDPIKENFIFDGWYIDETYTNELDSEDITSSTKEITVYAKWIPTSFTLSFDSNGGEGIADVTLSAGDLIQFPEAVRTDGEFYFTGWYEDELCTMKTDLTKMTSNDLTLYAGWANNMYIYTLNENDEATITGFLLKQLDPIVVIPSIIDGYPVVSIDKDAFSNHSEIIELTLPDSIIHLPQAVLSDLKNLESLTVPFIGSERISTSNIQILSYFFYTEEYTNVFDIDYQESFVPDTLKTVTLTDALELQAFAFSSRQIEIINLNEGITKIEHFAFSSTNIEYLYIPASVIEIEPGAFSYMEKLTYISIAYDNPNYSSGFLGFGLYNKDQTELLSYPSGSTRVEFIVPESVTKIGESAFEGNSNLVRLFVPEGVTEIGRNAFSRTIGLTTVEFTGDSQLTTIASGAFMDSSIVYIDIPASVEDIGDNAFNGATRLESITFAENTQLTSIGSAAFVACESLREIVIPVTIESMGMGVFKNAYYPITVNCESESKPEGWEDSWYDTHGEEKGRIIIVWSY